MVTKSPKFELLKLIVCKFVKTETLNWGREMRCAKKLIEIYPSPEFWMGIELGWRVYTLGFFLKGRGAEILKKAAENPVHPLLETSQIDESINSRNNSSQKDFQPHPDLVF